VHQDILDTLIRQGKLSFERVFRRDVLRPWALYNYGPRVLHLLPVPTLGTTEQQDIIQMMNGIAALKTSGYFAASQLTATDALLNLPPRTPEEVALEDATAKLASQPPPPPRPFGGGSDQGGNAGDNTDQGSGDAAA